AVLVHGAAVAAVAAAGGAAGVGAAQAAGAAARGVARGGELVGGAAVGPVLRRHAADQRRVLAVGAARAVGAVARLDDDAGHGEIGAVADVHRVARAAVAAHLPRGVRTDDDEVDQRGGLGEAGRAHGEVAAAAALAVVEAPGQDRLVERLGQRPALPCGVVAADDRHAVGQRDRPVVHAGLHQHLRAAELGRPRDAALDGAARRVEAEAAAVVVEAAGGEDRKSTRLNSSHVKIAYAVFCVNRKSTAPRHGDR